MLAIDSTNVRLTPLILLPDRYKISLSEVGEWLRLLAIEPRLYEKHAFVDDLQLELLDRFNRHLQTGKPSHDFLQLLDEAYLYRCQNCRDLKLSIYPLHQEGLVHRCSRRPWRVLERQIGDLELIATGSYSRLLEWSLSVARGLDDPFKGV